MNTSKHDVPRTSLSSKITSHGSFPLMKWLVIIVLLVLLLLAIFLPDRGLAISALGTSAYHAARPWAAAFSAPLQLLVNKAVPPPNRKFQPSLSSTRAVAKFQVS